MKYNLKGKVIVVTGASSGIGRSLVKLLLQKRASVVGVSRHVTDLKTIQEANKGSFYTLSLDIRYENDIDKLISFTRNKFKRIDMLVNNAGVGLPKLFKETSEDDISNVFNTNFFGPVMLTKKLMPIFEKQESGYFVNVASIAGKTVSTHNSVYSASKSALLMFSDCLRTEVEDKGIHILTVCPTFVNTDFFKKNPKYLQEFGHHTKLVGFYTPDKFAKVMVKAIEEKKDDLTYPLLANLYSKLHALSPKLAKFFA